MAYNEWSHEFTGSFTKLIADGGAGDDVFDASGLVAVEIDFEGVTARISLLPVQVEEG